MAAVNERQTDSNLFGGVLWLADVISVMTEVADNGLVNHAVQKGAKDRLESAAEMMTTRKRRWG